MAHRPRYDLKEVTTYASLIFTKPGFLRIRSVEVKRGGRFFSISETWVDDIPAISMN